MKILNRYIAKESAAFFGVSLAAFLAVLVTLRILKLASLVINRGVETTQVLTIFLSVVPIFLEIAIPMSALLGIMLAFARLSGDSEVVVLRGSGVSLMQMIPPVAAFGILCTALSAYVCLYLTPQSYATLQNALFEVARKRSIAGLESGVFNKLGQITVYADEVDHATGDLTRVVVDDRRDPIRRKIVTATRGQVTSDSRERTIRLDLFDGQAHELVENRYVLTNFRTNSLTTASAELLEGDGERKDRKARELSLGELRSEMRSLENEIASAPPDSAPETKEERLQKMLDSTGAEAPPTRTELKKSLVKRKIELQRRFAMPFSSLLLALLGLPLGVQPPRTQRTWGATLSLMLGMGVFTLYFGGLSFGVALGESGAVSPILAMWLPNVIIALLTGLTLYQVTTERWQSIAHGLETLLMGAGRSVRRRLRSFDRFRRSAA